MKAMMLVVMVFTLFAMALTTGCGGVSANRKSQDNARRATGDDIEGLARRGAVGGNPLL